MKFRGVTCVPWEYGMRASRLLGLHQSGCTFLGSSRRPAGVPEAAKGHALASTVPVRGNSRSRAGRHIPVSISDAFTLWHLVQ